MLLLESLESRQFLNAVVVIQANLSRTGVLTITGSTLADTITLKQSGNQLEIVSDKQLFSGDPDIVGTKIDMAKVKRIVVNAGAGRDFVKVEQLITRKSISIQLSGDAANDTLVSQTKNVTLRGGAGNDYLVSDPTVVSTHVIRPNSAGVDFARISFTQGSTVTNLQGFAISGGAINGTNVLEGGSGDDRLATRGGDDSVYGGDGNDTLMKLNNLDVYFTDLAPQAEPVEGTVRTLLVRVAAFGIDKIVDQPEFAYYSDYSPLVSRFVVNGTNATVGLASR